MLLQILSDLHLEFSPGLVLDIAPEADALIVAGDICVGTEKGFAYLREQAGLDLPISCLRLSDEGKRNGQQEHHNGLFHML